MPIEPLTKERYALVNDTHQVIIDNHLLTVTTDLSLAPYTWSSVEALLKNWFTKGPGPIGEYCLSLHTYLVCPKGIFSTTDVKAITAPIPLKSKESLLRRSVYSASGHGSKIPSAFLVFHNNRWKRVYGCYYSTRASGSNYIMSKGKKLSIDYSEGTYMLTKEPQ